jgi:hypothetical protein
MNSNHGSPRDSQREGEDSRRRIPPSTIERFFWYSIWIAIAIWAYHLLGPGGLSRVLFTEAAMYWLDILP